MKRLYSLNTICFVWAQSDIKPILGLEQRDGKTIAYADFPAIAAVDASIKLYHQIPWFKRFLYNYKALKEEIRQLKSKNE